MGFERLVNLQERITDLLVEIDRKKFMEEDYAEEMKKLRMLAFDLKKETEKFYIELKWHTSIATSAENLINNKVVRKVMSNAT